MTGHSRGGVSMGGYNSKLGDEIAERSIAPVKNFKETSTIMSPTATQMTRAGNKESIGEFLPAKVSRSRP